MLRKMSAALAGLALMGSAQAQSGIEELKKNLANDFPQLQVSSVKATPIEGLYEIVAGTEVAYMTADARYLINGTLQDLESRRNLTAERETGLRADFLAELPAGEMVVYPAEGEKKHSITVFTDVTCPYCKKLHEEIPALNKAGVEVRYLLYPRSPKGSPVFTQTESLWCAEDRKAAIEGAMAGKRPEAKSCDNPIAMNQLRGQQLGLTGTPYIVLESGQAVSGYRPADVLLKGLESLKTE